MKRSELSPPPPMRRSKRTHSKGADRGGYTFDLGKIAFADPMDLVGKVDMPESKRKGFAPKSGRSSDYHRKHG